MIDLITGCFLLTIGLQGLWYESKLRKAKREAEEQKENATLFEEYASHAAGRIRALQDENARLRNEKKTPPRQP